MSGENLRDRQRIFDAMVELMNEQLAVVFAAPAFGYVNYRPDMTQELTRCVEPRCRRIKDPPPIAIESFIMLVIYPEPLLKIMAMPLKTFQRASPPPKV